MRSQLSSRTSLLMDFYVSQNHFHMFLSKRFLSNRNMKYEEAIKTLNCLQNTSKIMKYEEAVKLLHDLETGYRDKPKLRDGECLVAMKEFLRRISITQSDLKKLNIIHVSGTKGKGSTCAFIESILRHHGFRTGFFSSPHLIEVRERLRINGEPISKTEFADYFEELYKKFSKTVDNELAYPSYFFYLTAMAFHIFLSKRVDVAIMEVGVGGSFDCTNVIKSPSVCGVSSLGFDHTAILGETLGSIAWHKAGIFKPGASVFTAPQPYSAMQVLSQSALETKVMLQSCPELSSYQTENGREIKLGLAGDHQRMNASLALQISEAWIRRRKQQTQTSERYEYMSEVEAFPSPATPFLLTDTHLDALAECKWKGRAQVMKFNNLTFYLDGAHTMKSMQFCAKWFQEEAANEEKHLGSGCTRILAFNVTKGRDAESMFELLQDCDISHSVFTSNIATFTPTDCADQTNLTCPVESQLLSAVHNHDIWLQVKARGREHMQSFATGEFTSATRESATEAPIFPTIADAIAWLSKGRDETLYKKTSEFTSTDKCEVPRIGETKHIQVLVTGSVHLVGGYLRILD